VEECIPLESGIDSKTRKKDQRKLRERKKVAGGSGQKKTVAKRRTKVWVKKGISNVRKKPEQRSATGTQKKNWDTENLSGKTTEQHVAA